MVIPDQIAEQAVVLKDQYFDLKGLAAYSSLKVPTLREYLKEGMPGFKVKGKVLVKRSEFEKWIEQYRIHQDIKTTVDDIVQGIRS